MKNEADIIGPVVEHLFRQDVQGVLIADNGSIDETPAILRQLAERLPVYLAHDRDPAMYQALKMNVLCSWARSRGADWIIPFDADELWFASGTTLGNYLRASRFDILRASIHNCFPVPGVGFSQGPWMLQVNPHELVKVAFRSHPHALLDEGNHAVHRPGVSSDGLHIAHFPWRSYQQFRRKTQQGREARSLTNLPLEMGCHLRMLGSLEEEAARRVWDLILQGQPVDGIGWSPGGPAVLAEPLRWSTWNLSEAVVAGEGASHAGAVTPSPVVPTAEAD